MKIYFEQKSWEEDNASFDIYIKPFCTEGDDGEIGVPFYLKYRVWRAIIDKLGWNNENNNRH